jgi:hypothetical protein
MNFGGIRVSILVCVCVCADWTIQRHTQPVPDYLLGTVSRTYENEEIPEKKHFVWCTSF